MPKSPLRTPLLLAALLLPAALQATVLAIGLPDAAFDDARSAARRLASGPAAGAAGERYSFIASSVQAPNAGDPAAPMALHYLATSTDGGIRDDDSWAYSLADGAAGAKRPTTAPALTAATYPLQSGLHAASVLPAPAPPPDSAERGRRIGAVYQRAVGRLSLPDPVWLVLAGLALACPWLLMRRRAARALQAQRARNWSRERERPDETNPFDRWEAQA